MAKLTQDQIDKIIQLYHQYGNGAKVAQEVGCTLYMVYKHLRANGIEPKKNGDWQQKVDLPTMIDMYQSGMSTTQIAEQYDMNAVSIWERLKNAGVQLRDRVQGQVLAGYKKRGSDEEVIALYNAGMNCADICVHYGLSKGSRTEIAKVLHKNGIKPEVHGERSPHWRGGKLALNKMVRNCAKYINWRNKVFQERDYTCEITGERGGKLNIHHIKSLSELLDEFLNIYPEDFESQEARLQAIEAFEPFWDKTNVVVITEEVHRGIHLGLISVL